MQAKGFRPPEAGDILWIDFGPPFGHEQAGRRPAFVVSPFGYNRASSLILVCPITRSEREWPFKVPVKGAGGLTGFVLADQVRSIDPTVRVFRIGGTASAETLAEVRAKLTAVIEARGAGMR
jgi:mRNA interferase MazF